MTRQPADLASRTRWTALRLRFDRFEVGGSVGDLGTFIPLFVGMVSYCGLQLGPALFFTGLANVASGLAFGLPMPVQPMKAIAAVAIAGRMSESQIVAAGILTGLAILLLAVSGLIDRIQRVIPRSVVRGLQLSIGFKLIELGIQKVAGTHVWIGWDSIGLGILCAVIVLSLYYSVRVPGALIVFGTGLVSLLMAHPSVLSASYLGTSWHLPALADTHAWSTGLWCGAIPQIPLTLLNSVIAVCALSADLFPNRPAHPKRVAISIALMNLICCPLGGMPMCLGTGGLAAQYRFGARTGGSVVMLGVAKMLLAVLLGGSLLAWLQAYPQSVLGVLLLFSGVELAMVCRDQTKPVDFFVMILTAGACTALNAGLGFLVGWAIAAALRGGVFKIEATPAFKSDSTGERNPPAC